MSNSPIRHFILIGLFLYVFGLVFFLYATDLKDGKLNEEYIAQMKIKENEIKRNRSKNTNSYAKFQKKALETEITENAHKLNINVRKTEHKKDDSKIIQRYTSRNSDRLISKYEHKNKDDPKDLLKLAKTESIQKVENQQSIQNNKTTLTTTNVKFLKIIENVFVFSSYFDDRQEKRFIRNVIIAPSRKSISQKLWCHFWDSLLKRWKISNLEFYETCENHGKIFAAYIGSCEIPENTDYNYIYISNQEETKIDEMTAIPVITHERKATNTKELSVCVPPLFGNINSVRFLEFIEFSVLLGFKHFTFYTHYITSETMKILKHYQNEGLVTTIDWPLAIPEEYIWYHGQSAAVWDCLYRNMHMFKKVAFIDIDEFIIPRYMETLTDFIHQETQNILNYSDICAYRFQSAYFDPPEHSQIPNIFEDFEKIDKQVLTLNCLDRKEPFSELRTKMIVDPIKIFELGIHHVSKPMKENFRVENVKPNIAFIHHYRKCENGFGMRCVGKLHDEHALRYKNRLITKLKWRLYYLLKERF